MKFNRYPKRDANTNYFLMPNEIFNFGLCPGEFSVYSYLIKSENRKTYQCYPSYKTIGAATNLSRNTVRKYVGQLEEKRFITTEYTKGFKQDGKKYNGNLRYTLRPIQEALDYFYEKQFKKAAHEQAKAEAKRRLDEYNRKRGLMKNVG